MKTSIAEGKRDGKNEIQKRVGYIIEGACLVHSSAGDGK